MKSRPESSIRRMRDFVQKIRTPPRERGVADRGGVVEVCKFTAYNRLHEMVAMADLDCGDIGRNRLRLLDYYRYDSSRFFPKRKYRFWMGRAHRCGNRFGRFLGCCQTSDEGRQGTCPP